MNYPELKDRIQSTFIDFILCLVLLFIAASIIDKYEHVPDWVRIAIFIGLFVIYEPVLTALGCTPGNYFKGSFLTISSNPQRRAIHDLAAGSVMIKLETNN